jgi:hypothetical protein
MKSPRVFELTKAEQRIVILIVVALVAFAFVKHLLETKSDPAPIRSTSPSPTSHAEEEKPEAGDSR